MQVILKENIENLGTVGDVVNVRDGYARNFLLPRNLVLVADESNVQQIQHYKKQLERKRLAQLANAKELAEKVAKVTINLTRKVQENDKLFGSVTSQDVADALEKAGYKVEKRNIHLESPIKTLGVHNVNIKFATDVTASIKVWVVKEGA